MNEENISKDDFLEFLDSLSENIEICGFTTDVHSYEWKYVNYDKLKFLKFIRRVQFTKIYLALFNKQFHKIEYKAFRISHKEVKF